MGKFMQQRSWRQKHISATSVVNFIKTSPFHIRNFTILRNEMGSDHESLLYHGDSLVCGKVLKRVVKLKDEYAFFFHRKTSKCSKSADLSCDEKGLSVLRYLGQYFRKMKTFNLSLQGEGDVLAMSEKITALLNKLIVWREHFENRSLETFPSSCDYVVKSSAKASPIKTVIPYT